jgi:hypothetical protein
MSCRDAGLQRQLELAQLTPLAPRAQQDTHTRCARRVDGPGRAEAVVVLEGHRGRCATGRGGDVGSARSRRGRAAVIRRDRRRSAGSRPRSASSVRRRWPRAIVWSRSARARSARPWRRSSRTATRQCRVTAAPVDAAPAAARGSPQGRTATCARDLIETPDETIRTVSLFHGRTSLSRRYDSSRETFAQTPLLAPRNPGRDTPDDP